MNNPIINAKNIGFLIERVKNSFFDHFLLILIILIYTISIFIISSYLNLKGKISIKIYSYDIIEMLLFFLALFFTSYTIWVMVYIHPKRLFQHIWYELKNKYIKLDRLLTALPILIIFPLFFSVFTSYKSILPEILPFYLDPNLSNIDQNIHAGFFPWQLLQPFFGFPLATFTINIVYHSWFFLMYVLMFWQAFSLSKKKLRMQFFLSFCLTWMVLGTLAAIFLSSAGPCFYHKVTGLESPYEPLMLYLKQSDKIFPLLALKVQEVLWETYKNGGASFGSGITAMPSMHVASSTIFALLGWGANRKLGYFLTIFLALILIGSVHLGWHYAIDGYVSILGSSLLWILSGHIANKVYSK